MLLSDIRRSTKSPIGTVPYDILREIFVHCLPQDRLNGSRPNTRIAPILLCHICSPWRTITLATPTLWSHLSFCFTIQEIDHDLGGWAFLQNEIEFIRWWKKNQGSIPPFLNLEFEFADLKSADIDVVGDGMAFVMEYVTTAQHLEIDPIFWIDQVGPMLEDGYQVTFPNLHTLVTSPSKYSVPPAFLAIQAAIGHASNHTPSALRRLAMLAADMPESNEYITISIHCSSLTHLSISTTDLSLSFWIPLTSAIPCLQWAHIAVVYLSDVDEFMNPIERTLPQLSTLVIESSDGEDCLMGPLFKGLHLPALKNLFLSSLADEWWDHHGIPDIYTILQSAPALSNLTLRKYDHLSPAELNYSTGTFSGTEDVAPRPIWRCVPHLAHLQLELNIKHAHNEIDLRKDWDIFAHSAFFSNNRWLALDNSACPIKTITVIDGWATYNNRQRETAATPSLRICAGNATNITFRLPSESYTYFADLWMTWRSGI